MDWLTFITRIVEALAWPVVTLVVVIQFKAKLSGLLSQLTGFKFGGAELQFEQEAKNALEEVLKIETNAETGEVAVPAEDSTPNETDAEYQKYYAKSQPVAAVLTSWNRVDEAINTILSQKAPTPRGRVRSGEARLKALGTFNLIPFDQIKVLLELRELRNKVAHGMNVSPDAAVAFVESADRLVRILQIEA